MREKELLSTEYIEKKKLIPIIKKKAKSLGLTLNHFKESAYDYDYDLSYYYEIDPDDEFKNMYLSIDLLSEKGYNNLKKNDVFNVEGINYYSLITFRHDSDIMLFVGEIILEISKQFPNVVLSDGDFYEFYTMDRIKKEGIPWLVDRKDWGSSY